MKKKPQKINPRKSVLICVLKRRQLYFIYNEKRRTERENKRRKGERMDTRSIKSKTIFRDRDL